MPREHTSAGRKVRVNADTGGGAGRRPPRLKSVRRKTTADYPSVPSAYLRVASNYSRPLLIGPPICDELVALVEHMFTEEEASLAQHIKYYRGKRASSVAAAAHRPVDEVRPILDRLADDKGVLITFGEGSKKRYGLPPLIPGVFEKVLIRTSLDTLTDWHRRFAELFSALYETGYVVDYCERPTGSVRYLPVNKTIEAHPLALPSDRLAEVLDRCDAFAVALCQCRMAQNIVNRGCERPLETCVAYGDTAEGLIRSGRMRRVSKQEVLEIKSAAESAGLPTFIVALGTRKAASGVSCSCCGCCCHVLRTINEFNAPGAIARPHFLPQVDLDRCTYCGKCAPACPMGAIVVDPKQKSHGHEVRRCIGCGLCAVACQEKCAIRIEPVPMYRAPSEGLFSTLLRLAPNHLRSAWSAWRKRRVK